MNSGRLPRTSRAATIKPHAAIGTGLVDTARSEVRTATPGPTSRSSSSGKDTTVSASTSTANTKPAALPNRMSRQPSGVSRTQAQELADGGGLRQGADRRAVDHLGNHHPGEEDHQQHEAERRDGQDRRGPQHREGVEPGHRVAALAAAADLVDADRGDRAHQGQAGDERPEQDHHVAAADRPRGEQPDDGIEQAQEHQLGRGGEEVLPAEAQRIGGIRDPIRCTTGSGRRGPGRRGGRGGTGGSPASAIFDPPGEPRRQGRGGGPVTGGQGVAAWVDAPASGRTRPGRVSPSGSRLHDRAAGYSIQVRMSFVP